MERTWKAMIGGAGCLFLASTMFGQFGQCLYFLGHSQTCLEKRKRMCLDQRYSLGRLSYLLLDVVTSLISNAS